MKKYILLFSVFLILQACKMDKNETINSVEPEIPLTTAQKIAKAYGLENWDHVETINFAFNVKRDSSVFKRSWNWQPKTNNVTLITETDTISYNRSTVDSTSINADKAFINDKFWLLAPFNLVWDTGTSISPPTQEAAPISKEIRNKITLTYTNEGGYTPGDAYDFYYTNNFLIEEWVYRKGNAPTASMITTWENNTAFNGVLLALNHKKADENWELFFTDVSIITN